jgi:hypothetical protein
VLFTMLAFPRRFVDLTTRNAMKVVRHNDCCCESLKVK